MYGREIDRLTKKAGFTCAAYITKEPTILKSRVIDEHYHQQLLRYDQEVYLQKDLERAVFLRDAIEKYSPRAIIFSDYVKGFLSPEMIQSTLDQVRGIPTYVDTKPIHTQYYRGATYLKPNWKEFTEMTNIPERDMLDLRVYTKKFVTDTGSNLILTRGAE